MLQQNNHSQNSDHFLLYELDWERNETRLLDASGALRELLTREHMPMTSAVQAVKILAEQYENRPVRFHVDVDYNDTSVTIRMRTCKGRDLDRAYVAQLLGGSLSPRELEIATEVFEGHTICQIARRLQVAEGTVKRTIHNVYRKLGVVSQVDFIREIYVRAYGGLETGQGSG